jgi:uncharacterized membrane protein YgcG
MDKNPYDTSIDWLQQSPIHKQESIYTPHQGSAQLPSTPKKAAPAKQPRMPKQKALELVSSLKKGIIVSSIMSFGVISLFATGHIVGTTTSTTTTKTPVTSTTTTTPSSSSSSSSTSSSSNSSSTSSSSQSSGASFGTSSSQSSVTSTSVS